MVIGNTHEIANDTETTIPRRPRSSLLIDAELRNIGSSGPSPDGHNIKSRVLARRHSHQRSGGESWTAEIKRIDK
ncbi:hypothetical protein BDV19DRAFT_361443 [Aspergillus venezuelensis]